MSDETPPSQASAPQASNDQGQQAAADDLGSAPAQVPGPTPVQPSPTISLSVNGETVTPSVSTNGNIRTIRVPSSASTRGGHTAHQIRVGPNSGNAPIRIALSNGGFLTLNGQRASTTNVQRSAIPPAGAAAAAAATTSASATGGSTPNNGQRIQMNGVNARIRQVLTSATNASRAARSANPGEQVNVRVVQIPNLVPQPITTAPSSSSENHEQDEESLARFKCLICSDFMKDPAGCGKCSNRFCHPCLFRVATGVDSRNNTNSDTTARCPTCRVEFAAKDIVHDKELRHSIQQAPVVKCRYKDCDEQFRLHQISDHEKKCPHTPCKCRYATYGCPWQGARANIAAHEKDDCAHTKMAPVIDQVRRMSAEHGSRLEILQQQMSGTMRMQSVHRQNLQRDQTTPIYNIFQFLEYCQVATCCTPFFFQFRDRWVSFHQSREARASVVNMLTLFPILLVWVQTTITRYRDFLHALHVVETGNLSYIDDGPVANNCLRMLIVFVLGCTMFAGLVIDSKSSLQFANSDASESSLGFQSFRELTAISVMRLHNKACLVKDVNWIASILQWFGVAIMSTFFPALMFTLSNAANGIPTSIVQFNMQDMGRAVSPVMFGLRYALLSMYFSGLCCADSACLMIVLKKYIGKISSDMVADDCFLDLLPSEGIYVYLGARASILALRIQTAITTEDTETIYDLLLMDTVFAFCILLLVTVLLKKIAIVGVVTGIKIAELSQVTNLAEGLQDNHTRLGVASFCTWVGLAIGVLSSH